MGRVTADSLDFGDRVWRYLPALVFRGSRA